MGLLVGLHLGLPTIKMHFFYYRKKSRNLSTKPLMYYTCGIEYVSCKKNPNSLSSTWKGFLMKGIADDVVCNFGNHLGIVYHCPVQQLCNKGCEPIFKIEVAHHPKGSKTSAISQSNSFKDYNLWPGIMQ